MDISGNFIFPKKRWGGPHHVARGTPLPQSNPTSMYASFAITTIITTKITKDIEAKTIKPTTSFAVILLYPSLT